MALDMLGGSLGFPLSISADLLYAPGQTTDFLQASIFLLTHIISSILCHEVFKDHLLLCLYSKKTNYDFKINLKYHYSRIASPVISVIIYICDDADS